MNKTLQITLYAALCLLLFMGVSVGCSNKKEKKPASFFSHMRDILTGKTGKITQQVEQDIQLWLDKQHPELGLKVIVARSMASLHSGNFDNYDFAVIDSTGLRFTAIWNNYAEWVYGNIEHQKQVPYRDFMEAYDKAVLYRSYTDTLRSNLPEDISAELFYRPQGYWQEPDGYMRFYIFSPEHPLNAARKVYLIENIRKALHQTIDVYGMQHFEASLCFIVPDDPSKDDRALYLEVERYNRVWLAAEIREEKEIPDFVLAGKIASAMTDSIKTELLGTASYTYPEYFLIRQDDFSELFYITTKETTEESRTFVYGIFTAQLELKEKQEIVIPRDKGYYYKEIEDIIPSRFRYRYVPDESMRSPINPFYNPYHNFY